MEGIIITILIYLGGTLLKNLAKESKKVSSTIYKTRYPNFKQYESNNKMVEEKNYKVTDFKIKDMQKKKTPDMVKNEPMDFNVMARSTIYDDVGSEHDESYEASDDNGISLFHADSVLNGIIMSELLSPPRALNRSRIIKWYE